MSSISASPNLSHTSPFGSISPTDCPIGTRLGQSIMLGEKTIGICGENLFDMPDSTSSFKKSLYDKLNTDAPSFATTDKQKSQWLTRLINDGYILLRDVLPKDKVSATRKVLIESLKSDWNIIAENDDAPPVVSESSCQNGNQDATIKKKTPSNHSSSSSSPSPFLSGNNSIYEKGMLLSGYRPITHHPDVLSLLESEELVTIFDHIYQTLYQDQTTSSSIISSTTASTSTLESCTFDSKWVRVMGLDEFTDEHTDFYRFEDVAVNTTLSSSSQHSTHAFTPNMFTAWIPLGDYDVNEGTLCICNGSHFAITYGDQSTTLPSQSCCPSTELPYSYLEKQHQYSWSTTKFGRGDVVIFDLRTIHASTHNLSDQQPCKHILSQQSRKQDSVSETAPDTQAEPFFRLSMDTRWGIWSKIRGTRFEPSFRRIAKHQTKHKETQQTQQNNDTNNNTQTIIASSTLINSSTLPTTSTSVINRALADFDEDDNEPTHSSSNEAASLTQLPPTLRWKPL